MEYRESREVAYDRPLDAVGDPGREDVMSTAHGGSEALPDGTAGLAAAPLLARTDESAPATSQAARVGLPAQRTDAFSDATDGATDVAAPGDPASDPGGHGQPAAQAGERFRLLLVGSSGGHLAQLTALAPWSDHHDRHWVCFDTPDAVSILSGERVTWAHHPTTRNVLNLLRNLRLAWRVLRRDRPDVVLSTGAGVAVPFFVVAKVLGVPSVYLEVYDRLDTATLTARLCRPFATRMLVQWEEQRGLYRDAEVVGCVL